MKNGYWILAGLLVVGSIEVSGGVPAFPGAEGFGADTPHARGKRAFKVTRLDDLDVGQRTSYFEEKKHTGCLRWALAAAEEAGGGYIVFDVAGTIKLARNAEVPSNVYIAGQSAPGSGIAIEGAVIVIRGEDVLVRNIRYRGNARRQGSDGILINTGSENVVIDHVSISFFRDGAVDIVGAKNVTIQWCHMGDAVYSLDPEEPYHCEPNLLRSGTDRITIHHCYYTHAHSRVPLFQSTCAANGLFEFSNNVVYNYRKYPSEFHAANGRGNAVGNFYVPGRFTHGGSQVRGTMTGSGNFTLYVKDNLAISSFPDCPGHDDEGCPGSDHDICRGKDTPVIGCRPDASRPETDIMGKAPKPGPTPGEFNYSEKRFDEISALTYDTVAKSVDGVLSKFGAHPRDNTDKRLLNELLTHTGEWKMEMPKDRNIYVGEGKADNDNDGMADEWEKKNGGNLAPNGHELHKDYDNIEVYLEELMTELLKAAPPVDAWKRLMGERIPASSLRD
ncbi:MAG: pectate lyase family protein [Kiritimatiellia bacterium]